jgi:hypothetical protein
MTLLVETDWDALQNFMNEHIEAIQLQKKGYIDELYKKAVERFGDKIPAKSVFKSFVAFYRSFHNIEKVYCENKYYQASPRKRRARTPPQTSE